MNYKPTRKVAWGPVGGAIGALIVWALQAIVHVQVPPEAAIAICTVTTFALQWFVPDARPPADE